MLSCLHCSRSSLKKVLCVTASVSPCQARIKHCFAELPAPTNIDFRIPVQCMLFGRKLGLHRLDGALQLFSSFERLIARLFQRLCHLHQCFEAWLCLKYGKRSLSCHLLWLWKRLKHGTTKSYIPHPPTHIFTHDCIRYSASANAHVKSLCVLLSLQLIRVCVALRVTLSYAQQEWVWSAAWREAPSCLAPQAGRVAWRLQHPAVCVSFTLTLPGVQCEGLGVFVGLGVFKWL